MPRLSTSGGPRPPASRQCALLRPHGAAPTRRGATGARDDRCRRWLGHQAPPAIGSSLRCSSTALVRSAGGTRPLTRSVASRHAGASRRAPAGAAAGAGGPRGTSRGAPRARAPPRALCRRKRPPGTPPAPRRPPRPARGRPRRPSDRRNRAEGRLDQLGHDARASGPVGLHKPKPGDALVPVVRGDGREMGIGERRGGGSRRARSRSSTACSARASAIAAIPRGITNRSLPSRSGHLPGAGRSATATRDPS